MVISIDLAIWYAEHTLCILYAGLVERHRLQIVGREERRERRKERRREEKEERKEKRQERRKEKRQERRKEKRAPRRGEERRGEEREKRGKEVIPGRRELCIQTIRYHCSTHSTLPSAPSHILAFRRAAFARSTGDALEIDGINHV